jgi:hypothetical protein
MRRKKPPNRRAASSAFGSEEPPTLIFIEPTISIEKDSAGELEGLALGLQVERAVLRIEA